MARKNLQSLGELAGVVSCLSLILQPYKWHLRISQSALVLAVLSNQMVTIKGTRVKRFCYLEAEEI